MCLDVAVRVLQLQSLLVHLLPGMYIKHYDAGTQQYTAVRGLYRMWTSDTTTPTPTAVSLELAVQVQTVVTGGRNLRNSATYEGRAVGCCSYLHYEVLYTTEDGNIRPLG